jgi:predicted ester cyclase
MAGTVYGKEAAAQVSRAWINAFPDVVYKRESQIIDGDSVVELETLSGTDTGGFMGLPPSNKSFECRLVRMYTIRDGLIAHERRIYDFTGMLVQIGVLKAKPA